MKQSVLLLNVLLVGIINLINAYGKFKVEHEKTHPFLLRVQLYSKYLCFKIISSFEHSLGLGGPIGGYPGGFGYGGYGGYGGGYDPISSVFYGVNNILGTSISGLALISNNGYLGGAVGGLIGKGGVVGQVPVQAQIPIQSQVQIQDQFVVQDNFAPSPTVVEAAEVAELVV